MKTLLKCLLLIVLFFQLGCTSEKNGPYQNLKNCFQKTWVEKKSSYIAECYDPEMIIYTNGIAVRYADYLKRHQGFYDASIHNQIIYDEESLLQKNNKMAVRFWIVTQMDNKPATKMEVVLIAEFKGNKIYRVWELTNPNWSKSSVLKGAQS